MAPRRGAPVMLGRLAALVHRRRWRVLAAFGAALAGSVVGAVLLAGGLSVGGFEDPDSEAVRAYALLERAADRSPRADVIVLLEPRPGASVEGEGAPGRMERIERIEDAIVASPHVEPDGVLTPLDAGGGRLVSRDGSLAYIAVSFEPLDPDGAVEAARGLRRALADEPALVLGGPVIANEESTGIIAADLARAELLAFPIVVLLSLWVFRGVVAALLPALCGGVVIAASLVGLGLLGQLTTISVFAQNLIVGLGLGLSLDYSLLILSRYREEIAARGPGPQALRVTLSTAGRSVLFSAITVGAALAALMVFPQRFLFSMGVGGVLVALLAAVVALVMLPAVLALLGRRVNALSLRRWRRRSEGSHRLVRSGAWYRLSRLVMRRPAAIALAVSAALVALSVPALGVNLIGVDARVLPESAGSRQVVDAIDTEFARDATTPLLLAIEAPGGPASARALADYAEELRGLPGAELVLPPRRLDPGTWLIVVIPSGPPLEPATERLVRAVRAVPAPAPVLVGGLSAYFIDERASLAEHLPLAGGIIAAVTLVVLFLLTGSVLLPLKAIAMSLLTLGATIGILVLIFQHGHLEGLLGYESRGGIGLTQPILLGALAFGLSTDYAVFLLSRIKEARELGASDPDAIAIGIQRTGRVVTAAALLFAVAVGALATSQIVVIKQLGVGTALAVLIDAFIIRAFLVPSLMALLGRANWWAPGPLARLHHRLGLRERPEPT